MSSKQIMFQDAALLEMKKGVDRLADAVKCTMGPSGRHVIIEKSYGGPQVTKDGVSVSKEITLPEPFQSMGAKMVNEVAKKTADKAGDGTTAATVLAQAIFTEGLRHVTAGANPVHLQRGINQAAEAASEAITQMAVTCKGKEDYKKIATVSANHNAQVGELIAEAISKVGPDGVVEVEDGKTAETTLDYVEGMQFDKGYLSPYFMTDPKTAECVLEDAYILIYEKKISNNKDLVPVLEKVLNQGKPILIIAEEVEGEALATLVINKLRQTFKCAAVKAPGYGDRRKAMLEDIAILTGGQAIFEDLGITLESLRLDQLGRAKKVKIDKDNTVVIEGYGKKDQIQGRTQAIQRELEKSTSDYDKEKLSERIAKLSGGVAKINVGAATESEMKEKKARVEDAMHATRAANQEGILPGGGVALLRASGACKAPADMSQDEKVGYEIVLRACRSPIQQIADNAGQDGAVVMHNVLANKSANYGYDARLDRYVDMVQEGIIDPTKVVRSALQNAASVSTLLLTSDALVAELPKEEKKSGGGGHDEMY
jgi:chaperonin GroEL